MRTHHFENETKSCAWCGITTDEWIEVSAALNHPCTGNAYICRVGRKLLRLSRYGRIEYAEANPIKGFDFSIGERLISPYERTIDIKTMVPWTMTGRLLEMAIRCVMSQHGWGTDGAVVSGLLSAIPDNPGVVAVLADQLEQDGCEDLDLLAALRTP